jgi:hypothetical protein
MAYPQIVKASGTDWTTRVSTATDADCMWASWPELKPHDLPAGSVGLDATPAVMPAVSGPFTRPVPSLKLKGLTHHILTRGHAVTATGKGLAAWLAGRTSSDF